MKKIISACLLVLILCCSFLCGCVGGAGWFTSSKKTREKIDGMEDYLASPENYFIVVTRYEEQPGSSYNVISKALYLYTDGGVCYYELDYKTGGAAHYQGGVLKEYYDGKETVTEGGKTFADDWDKTVIEVMRSELAKPVQGKQKGYHYLFFNYDKVFYVNDTSVSFEGVEFTGFVVSFQAHKDAPKYRDYELKLMNPTLSYELYDNISGMTPEYVAQRYEYFRDYGQS